MHFCGRVHPHIAKSKSRSSLENCVISKRCRCSAAAFVCNGFFGSVWLQQGELLQVASILEFGITKASFGYELVLFVLERASTSVSEQSE